MGRTSRRARSQLREGGRDGAGRPGRAERGAAGGGHGMEGRGLEDAAAQQLRDTGTGRVC